jgi:hypothetical protein
VNRLRRALLLAGASLLASAHAYGAEAPAHVRAELPDARLAGQGSFRWFGMKIYDARLWVGARGYLPDAPEAAAFALDLRYARALRGERIAAASNDELERLDAGTAAQRARWLVAMQQLFPDVREGSHLTGIYLPARGARFYFNGKLLGDMPDPAFARAFFSIWLDPRSSAPDLRTALLRHAAPG